ncbi:winged helix-turn-helix domain-containing tetratricopeptide repeat protein, partial [Kaarinaea lacus]
MSKNQDMRYQFNEYILDTDSLELSKKGVMIHSEPQVIQLLALFVENSNRLVSKEEINRAVWNGRIVSEAALSSRIKSLRHLLGDTGKKQQYLRTIHKRGFRFVADVTPLGEPVHVAQARSITPSANVHAATHDKPSVESNVKKPVIGVLPFANLSGDSEQEYFADALTADIITHLSKHRWLQVIARNTMLGFKGKAIDARELVKTLGATYVVDGRVQRAGNRIRVAVNLVEAKSSHQIWSDRYDRELDDIFDLQDEITETIAARIEPEIGFAERNRVVSTRPANLQAWDAYHLGVYHFFKFTGEDNIEAQKLLKQSQELDPGFGEAYAWWAYAVILGMVYWDTRPTQELLDQALSACDKALSLDSQNASFHALKARIQVARCEYNSALTENEIAINLNPTFAAAHCGLGDSLAYEGNYQDAMTCFDRAIDLSPNDPQLWAFYSYAAQSLLFNGEFEKALQYTQRASAIPNYQYWTTAHMAVALAYLGREQEAKNTVDRLLRQNPDFSIEFAKEKLFYLKMPEQIDLYLKG